MDAMEAILTRRSTRSMRREKPPMELIRQVVEAGRAAPSGGNSQTTHLIVITREEILETLREKVASAFAGMEADESTYPSLRKSILRSKEGTYIYDHYAPVLIVTANRREYGNAMADSACVLENMMIAANALDLGACWINQLHWLDGDRNVRDCLEKLGLEKHETVTGGLILGYPLDGKPLRTPLPRTGNPVTWI